MLKNLVRLLPVALVLSAAACDEGTLVDPVLLSTTASGYTRTAGFAEIDLSLLNQSGSAIVIAPCGESFQLTFERRQAAEWEDFGGDICPLILSSEPFQLSDGEQVQRVTRLDDPGIYRIRVDYRKGVGPSRQAYSNEFTVQ